MIYIRKNSEPAKLLWYRHQSNARFDDMDADVKEQLRDSLLREQGHLCAYCMREIHDAGDVKIEHFRARTPENELQYRNLLAVCKGGENGPIAARSCDTQKGNRELSLSPLLKSDMNRIYYSNNAKIHSLDTTECEFEYTDSSGKVHRGITSQDKDLEDCLNLNYENGIPLAGRKAALRKFQEKLRPYKDDRSKREFLKKMQDFYLQPREFQAQYVGILRWYINKKLR